MFGLLTLGTLYVHFLTKDAALQTSIHSTFLAVRSSDNLAHSAVASSSTTTNNLRHAAANDETTEKKEEKPDDKKPAIDVYPKEGPSVAYISYTHPVANRQDFQDLYFSSFDTWFTEGFFFLVMNQIDQKDYEAFCDEYQEQSYCQRIYPIYVNCAEHDTFWGASCYADQGLLYMIDNFPKFDWYAFVKADLYVRPDQLRKHLRDLPAQDQEIAVTTGEVVKLGMSRYDTTTYKCSDALDFAYPWTNPLLYSNKLLRTLRTGLEANAIGRVARKFVLFPEVAQQVVLWMYSVPTLRVPIAQVDFDYVYIDPNDKRKELDALFFHPVKDMNHPLNSMTKSHQHYQKLEADNNNEEEALAPPKWHNVTGFHRTKMYQQHGDPRTWTVDDYATIKTDDCAEPEPTQQQ